MKPASIKKFDWLYLGAVVLSGLMMLYIWGDMSSAIASGMGDLSSEGLPDVGELSPVLALTGMIVVTLLSVLLWAMVSVWRLEFMKWVLALFAAYGVFGLFVGGDEELPITLPLLVVSAVTAAMNVAAVYFLFRPDAKAWFALKSRNG